jgi:Skp family chaperone for outer membrane proteins
MKLYFKILIFAVLISVSSIEGFAQPAHNARERIETLKKMKMKEEIKLSEAEFDKLFAKLDAYEAKIAEKREAFDKAGSELEKLTQKSTPEAELKSAINEMLKAHKELQETMHNRFTELSSDLSTEDFAKLLVFERNFQQKLRESMRNLRGGDEERRRGPRR